MFKDLREFIKGLEAKSQLMRVKAEVDWNEEVGAIAEEALRTEQPALLFENIKDYGETHCRKLLLNTELGSFQRFLTAFGFPDDTHPMKALKVLKERCRQRVKPVLVPKAPCKEVIEVGDRVNLFEFPAPKYHPKDGGRYIHTWGAVITKDPETGWLNTGLYRAQLQGKNKTTFCIERAQHSWMHMQKYEAMGKKTMPLAVAIGCNPVIPFVAGAPFPYGVSEYEIVGAIQQEPLEVIKCETIDLEVPATAEIVLEGEVLLDPATFLPEGPFGEYPGTYISLESVPRNVFQVNCVTHRKDPIFQGHLEGMGPHVPKAKNFAYLETVALWHNLENFGVPGITGVYPGDPLGVSHPIIFVSIDNMYYGHARQVALAVWSAPSCKMVGKIVVVVDSDVDITDYGAVLAAIAQRVRPCDDVHIMPATIGGYLDPSVSPESRAVTIEPRWDRIFIDATWPWEWKPHAEWGGQRHPMYCNADRKMLEKVRQKWQEYGFQGDR